MKDALIISALSLLPRNRISGLMGRINRTRFGGMLQRAILRTYIRWYGVDTAECEGEVSDYPSLAEFFVRALRPGMRPVSPDPDAIVSPVDGRIYFIGTVQDGRIPQSDTQRFTAADLAGCPGWEGAPAAVLYLSPRDYHRVHTAREGTVGWARYLPGELWPVFPAATRKVPELFARNERLSIGIDSDLGRYLLVMVGAFGVGRMRVVFCDWLTNAGAAAQEQTFNAPLGRAEEIGRFEMGSTVVLLFPPGSVVWEAEAGAPVKMGQRIGRRAQAAGAAGQSASHLSPPPP